MSTRSRNVMKEIKSINVLEVFTWLDDLARWIFDQQLSSIKVCDGHLEATQSLNQADTLDHVKVTAITAELLI